MCDLVADPTNEITRITVVSSTPERVASLEALAAERGLDAVAATSPSLQRGWIRLTRRAASTPDPTDDPVPRAVGQPHDPHARNRLRRFGGWLWARARSALAALAG